MIDDERDSLTSEVELLRERIGFTVDSLLNEVKHLDESLLYPKPPFHHNRDLTYHVKVEHRARYAQHTPRVVYTLTVNECDNANLNLGVKDKTLSWEYEQRVDENWNDEPVTLDRLYYRLLENPVILRWISRPQEYELDLVLLDPNIGVAEVREKLSLVGVDLPAHNDNGLGPLIAEAPIVWPNQAEMIAGQLKQLGITGTVRVHLNDPNFEDPEVEI